MKLFELPDFVLAASETALDLFLVVGQVRHIDLVCLVFLPIFLFLPLDLVHFSL